MNNNKILKIKIYSYIIKREKNNKLEDRYKIKNRMANAKYKNIRKNWTKIRLKKNINKSKEGLALASIYTIHMNLASNLGSYSTSS